MNTSDGTAHLRPETETEEVPTLIARAQEGDDEAFCRLCRGFEARLLGQAAAFCGDEVLATDLTQEVLFEAWKSIRRYNGRCRFYTWLCAILINHVRNERRAKRPVALSCLKSAQEKTARDLLDTLIDPGEWPDHSAQLSERAAFVQRCLCRLHRKHREVVYLRFYADDTLEGIAAALGCSVGTVKSRLFYALEALRSMKDLTEQVREEEAV